MSELLLARAGFGECRDSVPLNELIRLLVLRDAGVDAAQFEGALKLVQALRERGLFDVESRFQDQPEFGCWYVDDPWPTDPDHRDYYRTGLRVSTEDGPRLRKRIQSMSGGDTQPCDEPTAFQKLHRIESFWISKQAAIAIAPKLARVDVWGEAVQLWTGTNAEGVVPARGDQRMLDKRAQPDSGDMRGWREVDRSITSIEPSAPMDEDGEIVVKQRYVQHRNFFRHRDGVRTRLAEKTVFAELRRNHPNIVASGKGRYHLNRLEAALAAQDIEVEVTASGATLAAVSQKTG
jgi:hypothetical protein